MTWPREGGTRVRYGWSNEWIVRTRHRPRMQSERAVEVESQTCACFEGLEARLDAHSCLANRTTSRPSRTRSSGDSSVSSWIRTAPIHNGFTTVFSGRFRGRPTGGGTCSGHRPGQMCGGEAFPWEIFPPSPSRAGKPPSTFLDEEWPSRGGGSRELVRSTRERTRVSQADHTCGVEGT